MSREDLRISPAWAAVILGIFIAAGGGLKTLLADYATKTDLKEFATKADIDSLEHRWSRRQEGTDIRLDLILSQRVPATVDIPHARRDRTGRRP